MAEIYAGRGEDFRVEYVVPYSRVIPANELLERVYREAEEAVGPNRKFSIHHHDGGYRVIAPGSTREVGEVPAFRQLFRLLDAKSYVLVMRDRSLERFAEHLGKSRQDWRLYRLVYE